MGLRKDFVPKSPSFGFPLCGGSAWSGGGSIQAQDERAPPGPLFRWSEGQVAQDNEVLGNHRAGSRAGELS